MIEAQCPSCTGRGYKPEARRNGKPGGFYARTCRRCSGHGSVLVDRLKITWHLDGGATVTGRGLHVQDAFTRLSPANRQAVTLRSCYVTESA